MWMMGVGVGIGGAVLVGAAMNGTVGAIAGVTVSGMRRGMVAGCSGVAVGKGVIDGNAAAADSSSTGYNQRKATIPVTELHNNRHPSTSGTTKRGELSEERLSIGLVVVG